MPTSNSRSPLTFLAFITIALTGCHATPALRPVPISQCTRALRAAYEARPHELVSSLNATSAWLAGADSASWYPRVQPAFTREHIRAGVETLRDLIETTPDADTFVAAVAARFDAYEATGTDGRGRVLFTGYFAPEYRASLAREAPYVHPLYARPPTVPTGAPWRTRNAIETQGLLDGHELAWLTDPLDAYLVHVNGSARLVLPDGSAMTVTHDGTNELPYTSLGRLLAAEGMIPAADVTMQSIRAAHRREPARVEALMRQNDRFVFFRECAAEGWPVSALGLPLTAECSLASDRSLFPPGCPVLVDTALPTTDGAVRPFARIMLDHDRGGAIRGAGRADLFFGVGPTAGEVAGRTKSGGRLYYLVLKHM